MASLDINNLGKFADMSAVWATHPEGGREGDFLTIGQTTFRWNIFKRRWEASSSTPGGSSSETIAGDLTVGGNLHVGGNADFEGDVTINGELHLSGGERYRGQSSYKSIVFTRADERPATPTDGSYTNPLPSGNVWKDGVPQGNKPIWMSSRIFTSDGKAPQTTSWSTPSLMSDAENFDVEFSPQPATTNPVPPIEGPNGNLGWLWFDPVRNATGVDWSKMNWMATRTRSVGSNGTAVWSEWTIILIKGEAGDGVQSVFTVTDGSTPSISGSNYPPTGWYKSVDGLTINQGDVLWMSERRFEQGAWSAWSSPIRLSGEDGEPGRDGKSIEFIYKCMNRLPDSTDSAPTNNQSQDGYVPESEGWSNHPSGVDASHKYEWACQRIKGPNDTQWSEWTGPFVWSAFGERGMDGDGVEYVFIRSESRDANGPGLDATNADSHTPARTAADRGYLPRATSTSIDVEDNNGVKEYTDNPRGVSPSYPYEWVAMRRQIDGVWQSFGAPALWATYSEEHTVEIGDDGYWIIDGVTTDKRATGVNIKGRVDVYLESDTTSELPLSLEEYPSSLTGDDELQVGHCWIVENGEGIAGHLFICVSTTAATMQGMWQDLGEFKGEPGQSQYMHLAWATKVTFNGNAVTGVDNFTRTPSVGRNYDWLGIKVTNDEDDSTISATAYKWNYLKGKDGTDVEFVYVRTTVNRAPEISEAAVQSDERYPVVSNINQYGANEIDVDDGNKFYDDPHGVDSTWKYEWMSRREKVWNASTGKMEWGTFLNPARLWSKYGETGESATIVKPSVAQVVIDTDADGNVPEQNRYVSVTFRLWYGNAQVLPTSYSAEYGGSSTGVNVTRVTNNNDPRLVVLIHLPGTGATTKDITITMSDGTHSASTTVPVIINRAGAEGRDVYKSIVFMRSASKPTKPSSNDGDYYHPVPSGTYNDGGTTRQWSDGVDAGTLPVWMTSRIFASDNQSPPQESVWSDVVLMQDVANVYDVEFTDADPDTPPGTPDNPAANVTWYDPVDDSSYLSSHAMNWMAQRVKVVTANGSSWSNWVVNRIRGEKGNDGAGQAYVAAAPDKIVVDCDSEGKSKRAVTATVTVYLMWGDEKCALKSSCNVNYSGGGTVTRSAFQQGDDELEFEFEVANNANIQSGYIQVTLVGTDSNSVEHVAAFTIPVITTTQGAKGNTGSALRFRGPWSDAQDVEYIWNENYRDCVKYNGIYYMVSQFGSTLGYQEVPGASGEWTNMGNMQFFATELMLAENGAINLLSSNVINLFNSQNQIVAKLNGDGEGSYRTYYPDTGRLRKDDNADGWTYYYNNDTDNTLAWMLGPSGVIIRTGTVTMSKIKMSQSAIAQAGDLISYNPNLNVTVVDRYVFTNEDSDNNGKVYMTGDISNNEPAAGNNVVPNGIYSQAGSWGDMYDKDEDKYYHFLPLVRVANGKIVDKWDERIEYQNPLQG